MVIRVWQVLLMTTLLASAMAGAGEAQVLAVKTGQVLQRQIDSDVFLQLPVAPGDYVAGRLEISGGSLDADLLDADGAHVRRIADGRSGVIDFRFVVEPGVERLRLMPHQSLSVSVLIDQVVTVEQQRPPEREYLSPRIARLADELADGRDSETFWDEMQRRGTPLLESRQMPEAFYPGSTPSLREQHIMTFLWRGAQRNVRLVGGPTNDHAWLERLGHSDVWYASFVVPAGTRLSYQLAPDVPDVPGNARERRGALLATLQMDPLNRQPWHADAPDRFSQEATVALPDAPEQPGTPPAADARPRLRSFEFASKALGNSRQITVAQPRDLKPTDPRIVLALIFDGERAQREMQLPALLDTLTREGRLPPVVAVLIPSIDSQTRSRELPGNQVFADVLADELLPRVLAETGLQANPARTVLAGASFGGLAAATIALRRPDRFGNLLSMSGSFWWAPSGVTGDGMPYVANLLVQAEHRPLRLFLSAGTFETAHADVAGILESSRQVRDVARIKGYETHWREYAGGHDYLVWRGALADGLIELFGEPQD